MLISHSFLHHTKGFLTVSECFYDDEHHGDKEDPEDGRNGRTEDDGDAHGDSGFLLVVLYRR